MEEKPKIIERVEAMDAETTKAIMWLLLQYVVNSLDCKRCPKKCEKPTLGRCMLNVLDEMEELNNATGHKTADKGTA